MDTPYRLDIETTVKNYVTEEHYLIMHNGVGEIGRAHTLHDGRKIVEALNEMERRPVAAR